MKGFLSGIAAFLGYFLTFIVGVGVGMLLMILAKI
jgi:hypothetical protein